MKLCWGLFAAGLFVCLFVCAPPKIVHTSFHTLLLLLYFRRLKEPCDRLPFIHSTMEDRLLLRLLRSGSVPLLCGGATCCFAFYGVQVISAARQWRGLELPSTIDTAMCSAHAHALAQHAAGCGVLTMASAVTAFEATRDYKVYRKASQDETFAFLSSRMPFFARPSVLVGTIASALALSQVTSGLRLLAPPRPTLLAKGVR